MSRRGTRRPRLLHLLLGAIVLIVVVVGLGAIAYFTPLMSVRSTDVAGNHVVQREQIVDAARVADGTPLLRVDTQAIARRIASIASIESVRVRRSYPSTLSITVNERRPVVRVTDGDKVHVLDHSGVGFLTYDHRSSVPPNITKLPEFSTPNPGPSDPTTKAALGVVDQVPEPISSKITKVTASSPVDIQFTLEGNKTVVWGDSTQLSDKVRTLTALLTRPGTMYNVSSPEFPAFK